jgi:hypothetical protein
MMTRHQQRAPVSISYHSIHVVLDSSQSSQMSVLSMALPFESRDAALCEPDDGAQMAALDLTQGFISSTFIARMSFKKSR